ALPDLPGFGDEDERAVPGGATELTHSKFDSPLARGSSRAGVVYGAGVRQPSVRLLPLDLERRLFLPDLFEALVAVLHGFDRLVEEAEDELAVRRVALDGPFFPLGVERDEVVPPARQTFLARHRPQCLERGGEVECLRLDQPRVGSAVTQAGRPVRAEVEPPAVAHTEVDPADDLV